MVSSGGGRGGGGGGGGGGGALEFDWEADEGRDSIGRDSVRSVIVLVNDFSFADDVGSSDTVDNVFTGVEEVSISFVVNSDASSDIWSISGSLDFVFVENKIFSSLVGNEFRSISEILNSLEITSFVVEFSSSDAISTCLNSLEVFPSELDSVWVAPSIKRIGLFKLQQSQWGWIVEELHCQFWSMDIVCDWFKDWSR